MSFVATINGNRVASAVVTIPPYKAWRATVTTVDAVVLSGAVTLKLGALELRGTITAGGSYVGASRYVLKAGAATWSMDLPERSYRSRPNCAAGVKLSTVLADAARECGETLAAGYTDRTIGDAWTREAGPASDALAALVGNSSWWLAPDGQTHVEPRETGVVPPGYAVTSYDPATGLIELDTEAPEQMVPGRTITVRDAGELVLGTVTLELGDRLAVRAQTAAELQPDAIPYAIRLLVRAELARYAPAGLWEYRVVGVDGDYLDVEAVASAAGLPQSARVPARPGIPGASSDPVGGSIVLVTFLNRDRARPVVVGYGGADCSGYVPDAVVLEADEITLDSADVQLGTPMGDNKIGAGAIRVLCEGDTVNIAATPPVSGVITITTLANPAVTRAKA